MFKILYLNLGLILVRTEKIFGSLGLALGLGADSRPKRKTTRYPGLDYTRFREICDDVGAILLADMAHVSGLQWRECSFYMQILD